MKDIIVVFSLLVRLFSLEIYNRHEQQSDWLKEIWEKSWMMAISSQQDF